MWNGLKHAFAVKTKQSLEVTARQKELVERVCDEIVRRRMVTPALVTLETGRPLNFVVSQIVHFFEPIAASLFDSSDIRQFANFLEQRGSVDFLVQQLEEREAGNAKPN